MKMTRTVLYVALLLATFGLGWHFGSSHIGEVHAQRTLSIPKAFGALKATAINPTGTGVSFVFEAADGTIRVVSMNNGAVEALASRY